MKSICAAFVKIFESYASNIRTARPSDLVLQIIPIRWITAESTIVLPSPTEYAKLAKLVYERCPVRDAPPYATASLVELAEPLPKVLEFKLSTDTSSVLRSASTAHVGYSWNRRSQWLSCAITDTLGSRHWTASFHVGLVVDSSRLRTIFEAIAREIWEILLEAMDRPGRTFIVKDGLMTPIEIEGMMMILKWLTDLTLCQCGPRLLEMNVLL